MRANRADTSCSLQSAEEAYFAEVQEAVRWSADPRHAALASAHRAVTVLRAPRKSCAGGLMLTRFASCFGLS